jgi:ABC-type dipeptide/oligopeptide/nickel transport system permease subunit
VTTLATTLAIASVPSAYLAVRVAGIGMAMVLVVLTLAVAAFVVHDAASEPLPERTREVAWRASIHVGPLFGAIVAALLAAEALSGTTGLGAVARQALAAGNLDALMMVSLPIAGAGLVASTVSAASAVYRPAERAHLLTWPSRRRWVVALAPALCLLVFGLAGVWLGDGRSLSVALRSLLFTVAIAMAVAALVALTLGFLAGLVSRSADVVLARAYEVSSALPIALVAGALFTLGGVLAPVLIGALRGVETAFLFRTRLSEGRRALDLAPISLGRTPIVPQLSRLLPAAARQPLSNLFLTSGWVVGLELSATALGATPPPALAPLTEPAGPAGTFLVLAVTVLGASLFALLAAEPTEDDMPGGPVVLHLKRRVSRDSSSSAG